LNEQALRAALEASRLAVWEYDIARGRIRLSAEWSELLGYGRGEMETTPEALMALVPAQERPALTEALGRALSGKADDYRIEHSVKVGERVHWILSAGRVVERDAQGRALRMAGTNTDITRLKETEAALRDKETQLRTIIDAAPAMIAYIDGNHVIQFHNKAYEIWLGKRGDEIDGRHGREVIGEEAYRQAMPYAERAMAGEHVQAERIQPAAGRTMHLASSYVPHRSPEGKVIGFFVMHIDITERKAAEQLHKTLAHTDTLTGLPNRRLLADRLGQALLLNQRRTSRLALLFIDLDGFKKVNDELGHEAGDALLVEVARRLRASVRASDTVARVGGDEFVVLLLDVGGAEAMGSKAGGFINALQQPITLGDKTAHVGASIGIAQFPDNGTTADALMRHADAAMYAAKRAGRGTWRFQP
jgi:diguanylate cyclase (GGDEF)-like protein/PAS domain S-box-containing protein